MLSRQGCLGPEPARIERHRLEIDGVNVVGLMLAAAGGLLPDATWLYLALSQIPMHRSPILLGPRRARCRRTAGSTRAGPG